jgi:hypothetical protein
MHVLSQRVYTRLGTIVLPRYRSGCSDQVKHLPRAFNDEWIASLPLPAEDRAPDRTVTLVDGMDFQRETDEVAIVDAYAERQRTRVFENVQSRSDGWFSLVALHLAGLLRQRVACSVYESRAGDSTLGAHDDEWDGVIVQLRGSKSWRLWPEPHGQPRELLTRAGDVLLLPRGMKHEVATPDYSVHLALAVTDEALAVSAS